MVSTYIYNNGRSQWSLSEVSSLLKKALVLSLLLVGLVSVKVFSQIVVTNTNSSGAGSLSQAIFDAPPGETIIFDPALDGGTIGSLGVTISKNLTIDASSLINNGITLVGFGNGPVFTINSGTVTLKSLTITNPIIDDFFQIGGVANFSTVIIEDCYFVNIGSGDGPTLTAGVYNEDGASLTIRSSTFGAITGASAIRNEGSMNLTNVTFSGVDTDDGGGGLEVIHNSGTGIAIANHITIYANNGAGIRNQATAADFELNYSLIDENFDFGGEALLYGSFVGDNNVLGDNNNVGVTGTGNFFAANGNDDMFILALADNGGPVPTCAITSSSPAVNRASLSPETFDADGTYTNGVRDAGAFEFNGLNSSVRDGLWNDINTWSCACVPTNLIDAVIAHQVTLNVIGSANNFLIVDGGNFIGGTNQLNIFGDFNSDATAIASMANANIFFTNPGTFTDPAGLDFGNIIISGTSLGLASPLRARSMTINSTRTLNANGNNIEIFGTGGTVWSQLGTFNPGGAGQTVTFTGAAPTINGTNFQNLTINSSGTATSLANLTMAEHLDVTAGSFVGGVIIQTNGDITINTTGNVDQGDMDSQGGNISVISSAGSISLGDVTSGAGAITLNSGTNLTATSVNTNATNGNAGTVIINSNSGSVQIPTIEAIGTGTSASGAPVTISAQNQVTVTNISANSTASSGNGADVSITSTSAGVTISGLVNTSCPGLAGSLDISAAGDVLLTNFSPGSGDEAGTLNISSTGGDVTISNAISINAPNDGGQIDITANNGLVTVADLTSSSSFADGPITITAGSISAGNINTNNNVRLETLSGNLSSGSISTNGQAAGDITVISSGNTSLGSLTADSFNGQGGTIQLTSAGNIILGSVNASSGDDNGGIITISANGDIDSPNPNISITASGPTVFHDGGSISITSQGQILDPLVLDASGDGGGGSVNINSANSVIINTLDLSAQFTGGSIIADVGGNLTFNEDLDLEPTNPLGNAGSATLTIGGDLIFAPTFGIAASATLNAGTVDITLGNNASIGAIEMSSQDANGGTLNIAATSGEIAFDYINTQSTNADGGAITLSALTNVIGSASFSNLNGNNATISTVGGTSSGSVFISHNDGNPQDFEISQGATTNGLFSSLAADPLVASDNFLNATVVGGNYTSGDARVVIRSPGPPFITTWRTTTPGESITIPTLGGPYLYDVDWGDGSPVETGFTGNAQHNYATAGTYTVSISGTFPRIYFADGGDKDKILTIEQWGGNSWTSMGQAFQGCSNLTYNASDVPDLTLVTDISLMFAGATSFNGDISAWNTTGTVFMLGTFSGATSFNQNLTGWNVSSVTTMQEMFSGATLFNNGESPGSSTAPLSWTTSSLQNTNAMFLGASSFNQNVNSWDVSGVTDMFRMFESASVFNQPLNTWDVSLVTSMGGMFKNATVFNQPLNSATWNTANVVNFGEMFFGASAFDQPLDNNWSVASTVNLVQMFAFATSFNQPLNQWGATKPSNAPIVLMFEGATSFNQPLSAWDVSATDNMFGIFRNAAAFDQDLGSWDVTGVTVAGASMQEMFDNSGMSATNYDATLIGWSAQTVQANLTLGAAGLLYCDPTGRDILTNATNNWTINDNGVLVDPAAVPQASQLTICDGDSFDFNIGSGVQTGYNYKLYSEFVDLGNRGNEIGNWIEGTPLSVVALTVGSNGIVLGDNLLTIVAEDNAFICEAILDMSLTISVNPLPTVVISGDATICEGESTDLTFTLTGTGPYDVTYNDGTDDVDLIGISDGHLESVMPTSTTTYTLVSVVDANSCSPATITGSAQVTVNPLPTVVISGDVTICEGESTDLAFTLTGTGPYDVTYNDGTTDVDLIGISDGHLESVTPTSTTTYTLISVVDANSCSPATVTGSSQVTVNPLPTVAISGDATICEGESTDLAFTLTGTGPYDVTYNDGTADVDLLGISDGHLEPVMPTSTTTYTLISVADANSCSPATVTGSAQVTVNPLPTVAISGDVTICEGESTDLEFTLTGTGPYDVTYNDGTADFDLIGISDGHIEPVTPTVTTTYTLVSLTDATSCIPASVMGSVTVTINPSPTVAISGDATICEGESTNLEFVLSGAGPFNVTYNDGTADEILTGITSGHLESVTPSSTTTFSLVSMTDANSCSPLSVIGSAEVIVNPLPVITLDAQGPFCLIDDVTNLVATPAGGVWSGTGITDANAGTFDPAIATAGTFTITYEVTTLGCTDQSSIDITVVDTPEATIDAAGPFCSDAAPVTLTSLNTGGTWSGPGIIDATTGTFDPATAGAGTAEITYTLEVGGCEDMQTITIEVNDVPEAVINALDPLCITNSAFNLTATPTGGAWSGNGITDANTGTFDPAIAGEGTFTISYSVTVNGCTSAAEISVDVLDTPGDATPISGPDILCAGDEALFTISAISGSDTYEWVTPSGSITTDVPELAYTGETAGQISVVGTNSCGTGTSASIAYNLAEGVTANFEFSTSPSNDLEYLFTDISSGGVNNWSWDFGDGGTSSEQNPTHTYEAQGEYTVTLTSSNGPCEAIATQNINVSTEIIIRIGNVITANNNGQNDFIYIEDIEKYPDHEVQLLNRWGKQVFITKNFSNDVAEMSGIPQLSGGNYVCRVIIRFGGVEVKRQQVISVIE